MLPCAVAASAVFSVAVCALARCAARLLCWCQLRFSRCSAALCAVAVCSRRRLFSVAVCYRSISSIIARCAARLLRWCQLRFSRCSAAVCCRCLSSASAVLRRRVCPRSMRCQASKCWCQLRSRVAVLPCAVAVYPRRRLLFVAVCALARCAARLLNAGVNCALALQCCRVQSLSILGVGCSPSPCALARCAARLLCRRQLRSEMLRGCSRAGRGRRGWETTLICVCDGELPLRV